VASLSLLSSDPLGSNAAGRKSPILECGVGRPS
jgi:hypothetical protein